MKREHKCPECQIMHKVVLPLKSEWQQDGRLGPLVKTWQSVYLKLGGRFCTSCRSETDKARVAKFFDLMKAGTVDALTDSLIWASQFQDAGIKIDKPPVPKVPPPVPVHMTSQIDSHASGITSLQLPKEMLDFCVQVPAFLERIAEKLETFQDFSNVWDPEDDEPEDGGRLGDFEDIWCPMCGKDEEVYEALICDDSDVSRFYCTTCDYKFTAEDSAKARERRNLETQATVPVKPFEQMHEGERPEDEDELETRLVNTDDLTITDLRGEVVPGEASASPDDTIPDGMGKHVCKGGICKC